jgi:sugar phosphate isomerase/epimerase
LKPSEHVARPLAAAHLTALDYAPARWVRLAAKTGFAGVGLRLHPAAPGGIAYPIVPGSDAYRDLRDTLDGEGVAVLDVEFVPIVPDFEPASLVPLFETAASLGATSLSVSGDDPDEGRLAANLAALAVLARPFGMRIDLEFMRWRYFGSVEVGSAVIVLLF